MAKSNYLVKFLWIKFLLIALLGGGIYTFVKYSKSKPQSTIVYLVRHAEKLTGENVGRDPALSPEGETRAHILAANLARKNISKIYATDWKRTRDTAKPLADELGLKIQIYNPNDLGALASKIKSNKGNALVVGHSNTIPGTVNALGGDGGAPIDEASEYDRLYVITIDKDGAVKSQLQHYGQRYHKNTQ